MPSRQISTSYYWPNIISHAGSNSDTSNCVSHVMKELTIGLQFCWVLWYTAQTKACVLLRVVSVESSMSS
jgi:hypothetical protein